jgi:hypothetical protein
VGEWGCYTNESGAELGKWCRGVNIVQILCTHECKWKNDSVETTPGTGGCGDREWWSR